MIGRYVLGSELAATLAGAAALFGHNWSVMLGLRGGAGGMVTGAVVVFLAPFPGAMVAALAIILLYISHYASVATLAVGVGSLLALAIAALIDPLAYPWVHVIFGGAAAAGILWALRPNLKRLGEGTERRITLW